MIKSIKKGKLFSLLIILFGISTSLANEAVSGNINSENQFQEQFTEGVEALKAEKYTKAYDIFQDILEKDPNNQNTLFYVAFTLNKLGKSKQAINQYIRLIDKYPNDWDAMWRLIVLLNAENKPDIRDKYRKSLTNLWKSNTIEELSERPIYLLDHFETEDADVDVFNYFEMKGDRAVRYKFNIYRPKGQPVELDDKPSEVISVGSYKYATEYSREKGEIGLTDKIYHLDGYLPDGTHKTYRFYLNEPSYDLVKKEVLAILAGKMKPVSGSNPKKGTISIDSSVLQ